MAQKRLMSELQALQKEKWLHIKVPGDTIFRWSIGLMVVNPDSVFHGAYLKALMTFTNEYPYQPPVFQFLTNDLCHPNVYKDGKICISILHKPGEDAMSGEDASERWSPLQGVESVLRSVLLLLDNPEISSPANVDAGVLYRDKRQQYDKRARAVVERSKKDIPEGVKVPTPEDLLSEAQRSAVEDDAFWNEADTDYDFSGSGSDSDSYNYDEEEEEEEEDDKDDD